MEDRTPNRLQFLEDEGGATAIEYALMASLVAIMCIVAMTAFGNNSVAMWNTLTAAITASL